MDHDDEFDKYVDPVHGSLELIFTQLREAP